MTRRQEAHQIVAELQERGYALHARPKHKCVHVPTALALAPVGAGFPALLLLQAGETVPAALCGCAALALLVWACGRLEVIWR